MIVFNFSNDFLISLSKHKCFKLILDIFFHFSQRTINRTDTLLDLSEDKRWFDNFLDLIMKLTNFFLSFTLEMGSIALMTVFIDTSDRTISAWKTICLSKITRGTSEFDWGKKIFVIFWSFEGLDFPCFLLEKFKNFVFVHPSS